MSDTEVVPNLILPEIGTILLFDLSLSHLFAEVIKHNATSN